FRDRFQIVALAAGENISLLADQIEEFSPEIVSVKRPDLAKALEERLRHKGIKNLTIVSGREGLIKVATWPSGDLVVSALVGAVGLLPTYEAIVAQKDIALANKETLVMAGPLVMEEAKRRGVKIIPVDSEHSAIFQALCGNPAREVKKIVLTASGGPFLRRPLHELDKVTPEEAVAHPRWKMGAKISVDSATLMNKALEVIEAHFLFGLPSEKIKVLIHPQSIVHSLVEYQDGSFIAQMGPPDMRIPIAYALSWPERLPLELPEFDLAKASPLSFEEPDLKRFPALALAYKAISEGGGAPAVLNAANEVAVAAFLQGQIPFSAIVPIVQKTLSMVEIRDIHSIQEVMEIDLLARIQAEALVLEEVS
ncbi:MAG TPA: 1-deoxy-D-xylulose-5-phosphate reductoisomerase, partial [Thermodesulfatator sp.]|nr:1-deoxy-D-xylulose-5-phosphate reductoisomerase [Thermodesulfatator sp.]